MCPTTTALGIKLKKKFKDNTQVSSKLREIGINKSLSMLFYITFDIPAMISHKFFKRKLKDFREITDELSTS